MEQLENKEPSGYKCLKCDRVFSEKKNLTRHMNRKRPCDMKIQCHKCGKIFDKTQGLTRHLEDRKTPCEPIVGGEAPTVEAGENKCHFCGRVFTTIKRLENHIQKCKIANNKKVYSDGEYKPGMEALADKVKPGEKIISIKESEFNDFIDRRVDEALKKRNASQVINNTFNGPVQINNITINFDGKQYIDHLNAADIVKLLKGELYEIIPAITHLVHGDKNIVQNHNIFLPNQKEDKVLVLTGSDDRKKWEVRTLREAFKVLMKRGVDIMYAADDELSAIGQILSDEEGAKFEMLINKQRSNSIYDEDIEEIKPILSKMKLLVNK